MSELPTEARPVEKASAIGPSAIEKTRRTLRRLGCGLLLVIWFALLMTPCGLFFLAANGEIRLYHADIPRPHEHPRLLISLISEATFRGLRIDSSTVSRGTTENNDVCIDTKVRFLLWEASGGDHNTSYCDCYYRADSDANWELNETYSGACRGTD